MAADRSLSRRRAVSRQRGRSPSADSVRTEWANDALDLRAPLQDPTPICPASDEWLSANGYNKPGEGEKPIGRIIVAGSEDVTDAAFWRAGGRGGNAGLAVCALGKDTFEFPRLAANAPNMVTIVVTHQTLRDADLRKHADVIAETLLAGEDVVVYCQSGYHRGPILSASLAASIFGTRPRQFLVELSADRYIWPGYLVPTQAFRTDSRYDERKHEKLLSAIQWADRSGLVRATRNIY